MSRSNWLNESNGTPTEYIPSSGDNANTVAKVEFFIK